MNSSFLVKLYFSTFAVFLAIDSVWLSLVAQGFYKEQIGFLLAETPNLIAAGIFYALFIVGLLYFVVLPALKVKRIAIWKVFLAGGFFGLVTYATYDLTNLATVQNWPLLLTIVDLIWGFVLSAFISMFSFMIGKRLAK